MKKNSRNKKQAEVPVIMESKKKSRSRVVWLLILFVLVLIGLLFRTVDLWNRTLEYDELWTYHFYSGLSVAELFTDLATPNNHPLHSLMVKESLSLLGNNALAIRLPAWLFGCGIVALSLLFAWRLTRGSPLAMAGLCVVLTYDPFLIHYSQTARGYSMQTFMILLFVYALYAQSGHLRDRKRSFWYAILALIGGVGACVSVASGLIFVCAFGFAYLISFLNFRKPVLELRRRQPLFVAGVLFFLFAVFWYGSAYWKLRAAQQFGNSVDPGVAWVEFVFGTITGLHLWVLLVLSVAGLFCWKQSRIRRGVSGMILWGTLFVFLSALFTKAGPVRIYQPLIPLLALAAVFWWERTKMGTIFFPFFKRQIPLSTCFPVILALCYVVPFGGRFAEITPPDWRVILTTLPSQIPNDTYIGYHSAEAFTVVCNVPEMVQDAERRAATPLKGVLQLNETDRLGTLTLQGKDAHVKMSSFESQHWDSPYKGVSMQFYPLLPLTETVSITPEMLLFVSIRSAELPELLLQNLQKINAYEGEELLALNLFFSRTPSACVIRGPRHHAAWYLALSRKTNGAFTFYRFIPKH